MEKYGKLALNYPCYPFLSGALCNLRINEGMHFCLHKSWLQKGELSKEANRKSQKLFSFANKVEIIDVYPFTLNSFI